VLACAAGFVGSMLWLSSAAGVALTNSFPEARSVWLWMRHDWHEALAYVVGFVVMAMVMGWNPTTKGDIKFAPVVLNQHCCDATK